MKWLLLLCYYGSTDHSQDRSNKDASIRGPEKDVCAKCQLTSELDSPMSLTIPA